MKRSIILGSAIGLALITAACGGNSNTTDNSGATTYECTIDTECSAGSECAGGHCAAVSFCTADTECAQGQACEAGLCRFLCTAGSTCAENYSCDETAGKCLPVDPPLPGSGAAGATSSGTAGSTGVSGAGGTTTLPPAVTEYDLIDDFEDGNIALPANNGRTGNWYIYGDNISHAASPLPIAGEMRVTGQTVKVADEAYGGIGVYLNHASATPKQNGSSAQVIDASEYTGITFRAKSGGSSKSFRLEVVTKAIASTEEGGSCSGEGCFDSHGADVPLSTSWTTVKIPLKNLVQEGWGKVTAFAPSQILGLAFEHRAHGAYDFWIDDVQFYTDPPADSGTGGNPTTPPTSCGGSWGGYSGTGSITHYWFAQGTTGFGDVHCSYGIQTGPDRVTGAQGDGQYFGAMNTGDYASASTCGACVEVSRDNGKSVVITIVDECPISSNPKCVPGHIDLSTAAFTQLGTTTEGYLGQRAGVGTISWKYVPCPTMGNITLELKEPTNQYWNGVLVRNHAYPIKSVQIEGSNGWTNATRAEYNYWIPPGGNMGTYNVKVTDINNNSITKKLSLTAGSQDTASQFSCQ